MTIKKSIKVDIEYVIDEHDPYTTHTVCEWLKGCPQLNQRGISCDICIADQTQDAVTRAVAINRIKKGYVR